MRARDGAEHQDQADQRTRGGGSVLEQLETGVVRRQATRHDPRADDGDDKQCGTEGLGDQASGEIEMSRPGGRAGTAGRLDGWLSDRRMGAIDHDAAQVLCVMERMRTRSSATAASNADRERRPTGSGIDQCNHESSGSSSSWA